MSAGNEPDHLEILTASVPEPIAISWAARQELLERLQSTPDAEAVIAKLVDARDDPIRLLPREKAVLVVAIERWLEEVGAYALPRGIWELRNALLDDLKHHT